MYVDFGEEIRLLSPEGETLCVLPPDYAEGNPDIEVISRLEYERGRKREEIAAARWEEETGGTAVQGMTVDTGRESQALITGAALQATLDNTYSCKWKTTGGFVELSAAQIIAVAVAVRQHVQSCFDREAELSALIGAAGTVEEIWEVAW